MEGIHNQTFNPPRVPPAGGTEAGGGMSPDLQPLARALIFLGVILAGGGVVLLLVPKMSWLGHLPGDIIIERPGFSFYFPLVSCLLASALISLAFWFFSQFRR